MKRFAFVILTLALFAGSSVASEYVYRDGYYWLGEQAYTRTLYQNQGYWRCGLYYPGSYYYAYTAVPTVTNTVYKDRITYKTPDWRTKLLDIAAQRDRFEGQIRADAFEHQYFLQSVQALGLTGNFTWQGYGTVPPYVAGVTTYAIGGNGNYHGSGVVNFGANATTQYGYSYANVAQLYGTNDLNSLYQQASQLTANAQQLGGQANAGFQSLVGTEGANRARVAEILAKGQMAQQIIQSLQAPSTFSTQGFTFSIGQNGQLSRDDSKADPKVKDEIHQQWLAAATQDCAACHSASQGKKVAGGFDIASYPKMTAAEKQRVWERITSADPKLRMPKDGPELSAERKRLWFLR